MTAGTRRRGVAAGRRSRTAREAVAGGRIRPADQDLVLTGDPLWYKDAIIYEVHVRAFRDSNGDGKGDFRGLTEKLDYLRDLGVTAVWVLPFYPSPLKDDGYDIADYTDVHPDYGSLRDVRAFIRAAHARGLRVITELVCNHTSDQHPWFQRARRAKPGTPEREFYVWSDTPDRYRDARIIFKDFEVSNWTWDAVAQAYYWHRFYAHQPDLNFDSPAVREAIFRVMDQWLDMGVDGLRLDAIPYLFEREGTDCENLPETHEFLKDLRRHVDERFPGRMLLAEANQWPEDAVAYFGDGDECHMAFHFPLMPRLFMSVRSEDRFPIIDILEQTPPIPDTAQWALFLRNHDELTLEMVTDEERDYMYRVYAHDPQMRINLGIRRRLAPLLGNHRRRIELMNGLLFSLPGTPVIYYGDEIGMGDNVYVGDRNGVRTPMQWSGDRNAGFSEANRQQLYLPVITDPEYHYEAVNVEVQQRNPHSLLWWMKRLVDLRKRHPAFSRGSLEFLHPENRRILAFVRRLGDEEILVVANLSRYAQYVDLDLSAHAGRTPVEMFGRVEFPTIGSAPYILTLGPHAFLWFSLEPPAAPDAGPAATELPPLPAVPSLRELVSGGRAAELERVLEQWVRARRWFGGKARRIRRTGIRDVVDVPFGSGRDAVVVLFDVEYTDGDPETYQLPLTVVTAAEAAALFADAPHGMIARLVEPQSSEPAAALRATDANILADAALVPDFATAIVEAIGERRRFRGRHGELAGRADRPFRQLRGPRGEPLPPSPLRSEQSNSSVVLGDRLMLKLYRSVEGGTNPDLEVSRFLTEHQFPNVPAVAGALEYRGAESSTAAILQQYVPNEGDLFQFALYQLSTYLERAATRAEAPSDDDVSTAALLEASRENPPQLVLGAFDGFLGVADLLGRRTGELHVALTADPIAPSFAPEPFTELYQRSVYQSIHATTRRSLRLLERTLPTLGEPTRTDAQAVLALGGAVDARLRALLKRKVGGMRIRIHGDYHAGQVLYTGRDVVIIDFEGEPARPLSERRLKRSPLVDVAGMLRSFHYAAFGSVLRPDLGPTVRALDERALEPWVRAWYRWVSATFLRGYREATADAGLLPTDDADWQVLLDALVLQKAFYEIGYELNNRPSWLPIPLRGVLELLPA